MHDAFISHSSKDKKVAEAIVDFLEAEKIKCWIAPRDVGGGNTYAGAITRAIKNTQVFVLVLSGNSNSSEHVLNEIGAASIYKKRIIPLKIDETEPHEDMLYYLSRWHWLDAINGPMENHLKSLVSDIRNYLAPAQIPEPPSPVPVTMEVTEASVSGDGESPPAAQAQGGEKPEEERIIPEKIFSEEDISFMNDIENFRKEINTMSKVLELFWDVIVDIKHDLNLVGQNPKLSCEPYSFGQYFCSGLCFLGYSFGLLDSETPGDKDYVLSLALHKKCVDPKIKDFKGCPFIFDGEWYFFRIDPNILSNDEKEKQLFVFCRDIIKELILKDYSYN